MAVPNNENGPDGLDTDEANVLNNGLSVTPAVGDVPDFAPGDPARAFLARGWDPLPLHVVDSDGTCTCHRGSACKHAGKHPIDNQWQLKGRMTVQDTYARWDTETRPRNTGIRTGRPSSLFVLDVDPKNGGNEGLAALVSDIGPLPETRTNRTGSTGLHFLFSLPADFEVTNSRCGLAKYPGLDVRGNGGFVVMPPSVSWVGPYSVEKDAPVAQAPAALLDLLRPQDHTQVVLTESDGIAYADLEPRQAAVADKYLQAARGGEIARLQKMKQDATDDPYAYRGEPWDDTTYAVACNLLELAQSPWASYGLEDVKRDLAEHAPTDAGFTGADVLGRLVSAAAKVRGQARPAPDGVKPDDTWALLTAGTRDETSKASKTIVGPIAAPRNWPVSPSANWTGTSRTLAKRIIRDFVPRIDKTPVLAIVQGTWHYWDASRWVPLEQSDVTDFVSNILSLATEPPEKDSEGKSQKPKATSTAGRIVGDLVGSGLAPELRMSVEPGQRIGGTGDERTIGLANGVLTLDPNGAHTFEVPSPRFFNVTAGRYDYDRTATCPQWEGWLEQTFAHDQKSIPALQEWFGAFLLADPFKVQKAFWLVGPRRSGKGTIQGIARRLIGGAAATTLRSFASQFGRENLIGHSLAIIDDSRDPRRDEVDAVVEFLLTYTSGGQVSIPRKNRQDWTGVLRQSLLAASNTPPRLADEGSAMSTRMEVIQTKISALGHEDPHLQGRLAQELPGILNWSLVGLERLVGNGYRFTQADAADRIRSDVESSGTGAGAFVEDTLMAGGDVAHSDLRAAIEWWTRNDSESGNPPHARAVKAAIQSAFPEARNEQRVRLANGSRPKGWKGVTMRCAKCEQPTVAVVVSKYDHGPLCGWHLAEVGGNPSIADEADAFLRGGGAS